MLFKPASIDAIVRGEKTQTRRACREGEAIGFKFPGSSILHVPDPYHPIPDEAIIREVYTPAGRLKWQVGRDRDYAVQPGRGKPGVWWNKRDMKWALPGEDINYYTVSHQDSKWQGWQPLRIVITAIRREPLQAISDADAVVEGYPAYWNKPYGGERPDPIAWYRDLWDEINGRGSWDANPDVWVLEFEVKRE
jgi:hypothetical protein